VAAICHPHDIQETDVTSGEDLIEEFFAVTNRRFLNSAEALLVDLLRLRVRAT